MGKLNPTWPKKTKLKILYFDFETTSLRAGFGEILMIGYQMEGRAPQVVRADDFDGFDELPIEKKDKYLVEWVGDLLLSADLLVGHFSTRFDFKFYQARRLVHRLPPLPKIPHFDTWKVAKDNLAFGSNRLGNLAKYLSLDEQKSEVPLYIWRRSLAYDPHALKVIAKYCKQDVATTRDLALLMMPLATTIPNVNLLDPNSKEAKEMRCRACGGKNLQRRGVHRGVTSMYHRYSCNDCGTWSRGRRTLLKETKAAGGPSEHLTKI